jgi:hypothetical protein
MFKTFKMFVEEKEEERQLKNMLLKRLGFEPRAMEMSTIKLRDMNRNHVKKALSTMGLDPDSVQNLNNFIDTNPDTTLQNLLDQLNSIQMTTDDQTDVPSEPAKLPQGQPKPKQQPLQKQQPPDMGAAMNSFGGQYGQTFGQ